MQRFRSSAIDAGPTRPLARKDLEKRRAIGGSNEVRALHNPKAAMRVRSTRSSSRAGFTLIELMIIVVIVGITAALAGPGIAGWMERSRAQRAFYDVLRVARNARSAPIAEGRAYRLRVVGSGTRRRAEVWRGTSNLCGTNPWTAIMAPGCDTSFDCVDVVDMNDYSPSSHAEVDIIVPAGEYTDVCWQPDGRMLVSAGAGWIDPPNGAARLQVERRSGGSPVGPMREIVLPAFGAPREWR